MAIIKPTILIVDDEPTNIHFLIEILKNDYVVLAATNGREAIRLASGCHRPDLILLDVRMPELDGYSVCKLLKNTQKTQDIPIVFVTALGEAEDETKGFDLGAIDYIVKPVNPAIVHARVSSQIQLSQLNRQLQELNASLEKRVEERTAQLQTLVMFANLTGLPSRAALLRHLQELLITSDPDKVITLLSIDIDNFSLINDSLGHKIGDQILIVFGQHLEKIINADSLLVRVSEDSFYLLSDNINTPQQAGAFADQIFESLKLPIKVQNYDFWLSVSVGIVVEKVSSYKNSLEPLRAADIALHKAKSNGKNCSYTYRSEMQTLIYKRLQLENDLRIAIKEEQFQVHYQPIIDLTNGRISGFEALARWQHPEQGMISPDVFIPCLEETGLIIPASLSIFEIACNQLANWNRQYPQHLNLSLNLSNHQFSYPDLLQDITQIIQLTGIAPTRLKLEITESTIIKNLKRALSILEDFKKQGIEISIDDFGTGYSSLSYLNQLSVSSLKVDRSFIQSIGEEEENSELARAIIDLGHTLGMSIIAEGCETERQLNFLRKLGCEFAQGYFFSKPLDHESATAFLESSPQWEKPEPIFSF